MYFRDSVDSGDLVQGPGEWEQGREWEWEVEVVDLGEGFHLHSGSNASGCSSSQLVLWYVEIREMEDEHITFRFSSGEGVGEKI